MKRKIRNARLVKEIEFEIPKNKDLVILLNSLTAGIDRVIVENKNGVVKISANGHSRFEFSDKKAESGHCDFYLGNPSTHILLEDYLASKFWGQFNFGELFAYQANKALNRAIKQEIKKLIGKFESKAASRLNGLVKTLKTINGKGAK